MNPKEVASVLCTINWAICLLNPGSSWAIKEAKEVTQGFSRSLGLLVRGNSTSCLERGSGLPPPQKAGVGPNSFWQPSSRLQLSFSGDGYYLQLIRTPKEGLSGPVSIRFQVGFTTETAMVMAEDDMWQNRDGSSPSILVLFNLSMFFLYTLIHFIFWASSLSWGLGELFYRGSLPFSRAESSLCWLRCKNWPSVACCRLPFSPLLFISTRNHCMRPSTSLWFGIINTMMIHNYIFWPQVSQLRLPRFCSKDWKISACWWGGTINPGFDLGWV